MTRRIADYSATAGWNDLNLRGDDRRLHDRGRDAAVPVERLHRRSAAASRPATTRGRAARWSGRPRRRRPPGTSTTCRRSAPSGRSSTAATPPRQPSLPRGTDRWPSSPSAVTPHAGARRGARPARSGISNPILGMILFIASEVMFFAGLFAAYFNVRLTAAALAAPRQRGRVRGVTSSATRPPAGDPHVHPRHELGDDAAGVWAIRRGDRTAFLRDTAVTLVLGVDLPRRPALRLPAPRASGSPTPRSGARSTR